MRQPPREVVQSHQGQRPAQPSALGSGVDAHHVHLSHAPVGVIGVHLRPVKAQECTGGVVAGEEQSVGIEPGFGDTFDDIGIHPATLFRMPVEGGVVDPQQLGVVLASTVGVNRNTDGHNGFRDILQQSAHLDQLTPSAQPADVGDGAGARPGAMRPEPHPRTAALDRRPHQGTPDATSAGIGMYHQFRCRVVDVGTARRQVEITRNGALLGRTCDDEMFGALPAEFPQHLLPDRAD